MLYFFYFCLCKKCLELDKMCTVLYALTFGCWQDERERETAIHQRLEKKWLGNIRIPFSTIYLNGKVSLSIFWAQ